MTNIHEIEDKVRTYILESFLTGTAGETFRNDDDLLALLDSLQVLRMLIAFESLFLIKVQDSELVPENLGSVRQLAAFIARKRGVHGQVQPGPELGTAPATVR